MFGGTSSRKFSRLNEDDVVDAGPPQSVIPPSPLTLYNTDNHVTSHDETTFPHSPSRGRKMLRSVACIAGGGSPPKRIELQDDEDDYGPPYRTESTRPEHQRKDKLHYSSTQQEPPGAYDEPSNNGDKSDSSSRELVVDPPLIARATSQASEEQSLETLRQKQLDEAIQEVIDSEFAAMNQTQQQEESVRGFLPVQPTFDDEHVVFRPSSEADTDVSRGSDTQNEVIQEYRKRNAKPAKPVTLDDDDEDGGEVVAAENPHHEKSFSSSIPNGESFNHIRSLIARVQRLDAVVQAGEEEEAVRSAVDETSRSKAGEASVSAAETDRNPPEPKVPQVAPTPVAIESSPVSSHDSSVDQRSRSDSQSQPESSSVLSPPHMKPLVSPAHDSLTRQRTQLNGSESPLVSDSNGSPNTKPLYSPVHDGPTRQKSQKENRTNEETIQKDDDEEEDGSQHFQIIYRRSRDTSPVASHTKTSLATASSIVTMSSFGIPGVPTVQKHVPVVTPPARIQHSTKQVTSHPFFWRTHPIDTFTSYGPNRPKTRLAPVQTGKKKAIVSAPRSRRKIAPLKSPMKRVEEVVDVKYDTRYRERGHGIAWPPESYAHTNSPWNDDGDPEFSPYGDEHGTDRPSVKGIPLYSATRSTSSGSARPSTTSDSWVAFSEFSVGSTEQFQ